MKMSENKGFAVEVTSRYDAWWRYNVAIVCGCFDAAGNRVEFVSAEDRIAAVGDGLSAPPEGWCGADRRQVTLRSGVCDHIVMYVYVIPHTLPATREVDEARPFDLRLKIAYGGKVVRDTHYRINAWSGTSLEIKLRNDGTPLTEGAG